MFCCRVIVVFSFRKDDPGSIYAHGRLCILFHFTRFRFIRIKLCILYRCSIAAFRDFKKVAKSLLQKSSISGVYQIVKVLLGERAAAQIQMYKLFGGKSYLHFKKHIHVF
jgi:hypothetical protein